MLWPQHPLPLPLADVNGGKYPSLEKTGRSLEGFSKGQLALGLPVEGGPEATVISQDLCSIKQENEATILDF